MTHTLLDTNFLTKKHFVVNQLTKELLDALDSNLVSRDSGRELAMEVLESKDSWQTTEDLVVFLKKTSVDYPFLRKLSESFQESVKGEEVSKKFSEKDSQKLEQIQDQLAKLSQTS